jgi:Xylose isomerase-like TIM barrel
MAMLSHPDQLKPSGPNEDSLPALAGTLSMKQWEVNGPLSLSLSPSKGERVPKAGEGAVQRSKGQIAVRGFLSPSHGEKGGGRRSASAGRSPSTQEPKRRVLALTRRDFVSRTLAASSTVALCGGSALSVLGDENSSPPIVVFSKVYQELKLDFEAAAALTAEAGIDGIDCPVRPGGEILPEHATGELPKYAAAMRKRALRLPLLTTAITKVSSPYAEDILRTAKQLGVEFYRLGFIMRESNASTGKQMREITSQLKDLAALNKQVGIGAIIQNHSPAGQAYVGGDLSEMYQLVKDFDPAQIGVAFDIGHALVVHGDGSLRS